MIFQQFNLIPYLSLMQNIVLACEFSPLRKKRVLQQSASLKQEALRLLAQLDITDPELLQKPVMDLSVGQQQRVATARALIGSPEIIIADEPTSALDTEVRDKFIDLLIRETSTFGSTLLFVSHDIQLQKHFDRCICLQDINCTGNSAVNVEGRNL